MRLPVARIDPLASADRPNWLSAGLVRLLVLCACAGHSAEEVAAELGCSQNAVRLRLLRARERFRQVYAETSDEIGLPQTR